MKFEGKWIETKFQGLNILLLYRSSLICNISPNDSNHISFKYKNLVNNPISMDIHVGCITI